MALIDQLIVFIVGLLIGGLAIYVGARTVMGSRDYSYAVVTALLGAITLAIAQWILSAVGVDLVGLSYLIILVVWIWVIKWRYSSNWVNAAITGGVATLTLIVVLWLTAALGITTPEAVGFPPGVL